MRGILEQLFQANLIFPPGQGREKQFAALGEEVHLLKQQLEAKLDDELKCYLERLEDFHNLERLLTYENGFLLATALWWQVMGRLGGSES